MRTRTAVSALALALVAGCAPAVVETPAEPAVQASTEPTATALGDCSRANLTTLVSGSLTVATTRPLVEPWFVDEDPETGEGFASALVYAIAAELGFSRLEVAWQTERGSVLPALAPVTPTADFAIAQMPIQQSVASPVAFSDPYLAMSQALVVPAGSPLALDPTVAALAGSALGAVGDEAAALAEEAIGPRLPVRRLATTGAAAAALRAGELAGVVVDLPAVAGMTDGLDGLVVAGRFPPASAPVEYGLAFAPGNPLVGCVNGALAALEERGELEALERAWLAGGTAPMITP